MKKGILFCLPIAAAVFFVACNGDSSDNTTLKDSRDGKTYKLVTIGSQTWMAENLNYETKDSRCFEDSVSRCAKYGRLYSWSDAKTACPSKYHLPDTAEWNLLFETVGGKSDAGYILKSKSDWKPKGEGSDEFGFSALPTGFFNDGGFRNYRKTTRFWSSTTRDRGGFYYVQLDYKDEYASIYNTDKVDGFSVRCVKD
jgi:uncharacterized protein (TIGR02145 family)